MGNCTCISAKSDNKVSPDNSPEGDEEEDDQPKGERGGHAAAFFMELNGQKPELHNKHLFTECYIRQPFMG